MFNQEIRSTWSIASVLVMFVLMVTPPFLTALGVVREKENGSIYNIYASTVTRGEFLVGKLAPYVGISIINFFILWLLATQLFGAPFKGAPAFSSSSRSRACCSSVASRARHGQRKH